MHITLGPNTDHDTREQLFRVWLSTGCIIAINGVDYEAVRGPSEGGLHVRVLNKVGYGTGEMLFIPWEAIHHILIY